MNDKYKLCKVNGTFSTMLARELDENGLINVLKEIAYYTHAKANDISYDALDNDDEYGFSEDLPEYKEKIFEYNMVDILAESLDKQTKTLAILNMTEEMKKLLIFNITEEMKKLLGE